MGFLFVAFFGQPAVFLSQLYSRGIAEVGLDFLGSFRRRPWISAFVIRPLPSFPVQTNDASNFFSMGHQLIFYGAGFLEELRAIQGF